jgi:hypothetical protein
MLIGRMRPRPRPQARRSTDSPARRTEAPLSMLAQFSLDSLDSRGFKLLTGALFLSGRHRRLEVLMHTLSKLLQDNGLHDQPILLVEAHRDRGGIWRIKFSYDEVEPLSMDSEQASKFAITLREIGEDEIASEICEAVLSAHRYATMSAPQPSALKVSEVLPRTGYGFRSLSAE